MSDYPLPDKDILAFQEAQYPEVVVSSWASGVFSLALRGFTKQGIFNVPHTSLSTRASSSTTFRLPDKPFAFGVVPVTGIPRRGEIYLQVVYRLAGVEIGKLFEGYLNEGNRAAFPPLYMETPTALPGFLRSIAGSNPAAGAEIAESVPTNAEWRFKALRATLVTSADVATRNVSFIVDDGANALYQTTLAPNQTASQTRAYEFAFADKVDETAFDANNQLRLYAPARMLDMAQGWRVRTLTNSLQAADDWGAPQYSVEESLHPQS